MHHGAGARTGLYFREVAVHGLGEVPRYYSLVLSHGVLLRFLRFRLGCHHLRIHTGTGGFSPHLQGTNARV